MDSVKDTYFNRNAVSVAAVEFFWGLGFPVIMESTFLQIFLKHLGASDFLIGLVPAILITGLSLCPLLSSYLTRNREEKKGVVIGLHLVSSLATLLFGTFLFFASDPKTVLAVFFASYVLFSFCIGLTFPVWLNFLVKIFSEKRSVPGLGLMYMAQNIAKVIASVFILRIVEAYAFSLYSAAWVFVCSGLFFLAGSMCFIFTKELPPESKSPLLQDSFFSHARTIFMDMIRNRNMLKYLAGDLDHFVGITVISFYANYATQYYGIEDYTAAGLFIGFVYTGSICSNILLGTLDYLSLKAKFLATKILSLVTLTLLIFFPGFGGFLTASFLMGFCRGTRGLVYSPAIKKFCKKEDATGYFAVAPLLTLVFGCGFPMLFGRMLDHFSTLGSSAYKIMFGISFGIVVMALIFGLLTDFEAKIKKNP